MPAIGYLTRRADDTYLGELSTLTVNCPLELVHNVSKMSAQDPDYVVLAKDVELGYGWKKVSQETKKEYVTLSLATPEFGCKPLTANLGLMKGEAGDRFVMIWNPET